MWAREQLGDRHSALTSGCRSRHFCFKAAKDGSGWGTTGDILFSFSSLRSFVRVWRYFVMNWELETAAAAMGTVRVKSCLFSCLLACSVWTGSRWLASGPGRSIGGCPFPLFSAERTQLPVRVHARALAQSRGAMHLCWLQTLSSGRQPATLTKKRR